MIFRKSYSNGTEFIQGHLAMLLENLSDCTAVIVNYRTRHLTAICLGLLQKHLPGLKIIVIDNDSKDDSIAYLRNLDWITLVERKSKGEAPHIAHARALDLGLNHVETKYMLCLHSDSLIYDNTLIKSMLKTARQKGAAAVGTLEQVYRSPIRQAWRTARRFVSSLWTQLIPLSNKVKHRHGYREQHLKSFCCLWNTDILKANNLTFEAAGKNPGYAMQDRLKHSGHKLVELPARFVFEHMDHVQSGTMTEIGLHQNNKRRRQAYNRLVPIALARSGLINQ
jgi:hypothetical protein